MNRAKHSSVISLAWCCWEVPDSLCCSMYSVLHQRCGQLPPLAISTLSLIPQTQAINQQQETFVHDLLRRGLTRIYSDYWTCDRTTFQSKEKIICSDLIFINGQLKAHDRYAPYYAIVHANLHAAYILRIGSTEAETFAQKIESHTDQQFLHFRMDGYEVYQPW